MNKKDLKIGLALGSGGARGLLHLGVLRSLEQHDMKPQFLAGTSIGALVAAMYASGQSLREIEDKVFSMKWEALLSFFDPTILKGGFVKGEKLAELVREWVGVETFADLKLPVVAVATDLISAEEVRMDSGDLINAIMASMAVPMFFKPVKRDQYLLVDGGLCNPVPDDVVRSMGADKVIAVNLDYRKNSKNSEEDYKWTAKVAYRAFNISRHYLAEHSIRDADVLISPNIDDPSVMGFKHFLTDEKAWEMIKMGETLMDEAIWKSF